MRFFGKKDEERDAEFSRPTLKQGEKMRKLSCAGTRTGRGVAQHTDG
jgi:hypothetical protein